MPFIVRQFTVFELFKKTLEKKIELKTMRFKI